MSQAAHNRLGGFVLAAIIFAADQAMKWLIAVQLHMQEGESIPLLPIFAFTRTHNYGVSLGMFTATSGEMRWGLVVVTGLIALAVIVWMLREKRLGDILPLALVLGGALGNIYDRFTRGFVVDYLDLHFGEWRPFFIFNFADVCITLGVLIILARSLLSREKPATATKSADAAPES